MYLCYIDESGTPEIPGNTSHYVLLGISIPIWKWKYCERAVQNIKVRYQLTGKEIHTGWLLRPYLEQAKIANFEALPYPSRAREVEKMRTAEILRLQKARNPALLKQTKKNFKQTHPYIHLSYQERKTLVTELAKLIGSWGFARVFSECIDKVHFDPKKTGYSVDEQAFDQLVSRFQHYLRTKISKDQTRDQYGMLIHDNNETVARKHTELMLRFHKLGTKWTALPNIIETPLFVNSELTSMVQLADLCSYAVRRYLENNEQDLINEILKRVDRKGKKLVGIRHFTNDNCYCIICTNH
jgi:hypothetical protein